MPVRIWHSFSESRPWALGKAEDTGARDPALDSVLYHLTDTVYVVGLLLLPLLPRAAAEILLRFGRDIPNTVEVKLGLLRPGAILQLGAPLFPKR